MDINKATLHEFCADFKQATKVLEEKYQVSIHLGSISYEENRFSTKLTVKNGGSEEERARLDFDADVWRYQHIGLNKGMYHRIFIGCDGERYALEGFMTSAKKYPIIVTRIRDGQKIRVSEKFIRTLEDSYYDGDCDLVVLD